MCLGETKGSLGCRLGEEPPGGSAVGVWGAAQGAVKWVTDLSWEVGGGMRKCLISSSAGSCWELILGAAQLERPRSGSPRRHLDSGLLSSFFFS